MYISDIVFNEISGCSQEKPDILLGYLKQIQYHLVHTDEDTVELAEKFIDFGILKKKSFDDCQHIAAAILAGYKDLLIYPPSVLLEGDDEDDDETDSE